jgi:ribosomal protein S18 acetylase RimI-like enzyme
MNWQVRSASVSDVDSLALVGAATFLETFAGVLDGAAIVAHCQREHSPATYERYLGTGAQAWLAESDPGRAPVGFALLADTDLPGSAPDGGDIELKRIYALSRFHGGGLGGELMRRAVEEARRRRARRLLLGVYAGNARAQAFYAKSGFAKIAERRFRVGDREYDDLVLARRLD